MPLFIQFIQESLDIKSSKATSLGLTHISFNTYEDQSKTRYHWDKSTQSFELTKDTDKSQISFQNLSNGNILFNIDGKRYDYHISDWGMLNFHINKFRKQPGKLLNWVKKTSTEVTLRSNGKWAKIEKDNDDFHIAMGYDGESKPFKTQKTNDEDHAETIRDGWLND